MYIYLLLPWHRLAVNGPTLVAPIRRRASQEEARASNRFVVAGHNETIVSHFPVSIFEKGELPQYMKHTGALSCHHRHDSSSSNKHGATTQDHRKSPHKNNYKTVFFFLYSPARARLHTLPPPVSAFIMYLPAVQMRRRRTGAPCIETKVVTSTLHIYLPRFRYNSSSRTTDDGRQLTPGRETKEKQHKHNTRKRQRGRYSTWYGTGGPADRQAGRQARGALLHSTTYSSAILAWRRGSVTPSTPRRSCS